MEQDRFRAVGRHLFHVLLRIPGIAHAPPQVSRRFARSGLLPELSPAPPRPALVSSFYAPECEAVVISRADSGARSQIWHRRRTPLHPGRIPFSAGRLRGAMAAPARSSALGRVVGSLAGRRHSHRHPRLHPAWDHGRFRPVYRQPHYSPESAGWIFPLARELSSGTSPVPRGTQLSPASLAPFDLAAAAQGGFGPQLSWVPCPLPSRYTPAGRNPDRT